jgi:energy coupling factor transporter S component ThiW
MNRTRLITTMAVLTALGTITAQLVWFPAGIARAYPMQHAINVAAAVTLGPGPAVIIAFLISLFRNMLGLGTLLAFPGSMVGAFFAGYLYRKSGRNGLAAIGEGVGSGIVGALLSVPLAYLFMGSSVGALAFIPPFLVSSTTGAIIGWFIVSRIKTVNVIRN